MLDGLPLFTWYYGVLGGRRCRYILATKAWCSVVLDYKGMAIGLTLYTRLDRNMDIKGSRLEAIFDLIAKTYTDNGSELCGHWSDWPRLNQYYPTPTGMSGDFIRTNEYNLFEQFVNEQGSHPVLGSRMVGDDIAALAALQESLGLVLVKEVSAENAMTYPGYKNRYWKITTQFGG